MAEHDHGDVIRPHDWPFPGDRFPDDFGVIAMNSVVEGKRPALQVVHFPPDTVTGHGSAFGVADGIDWPDEKNSVLTHIHHLLQADPTLGELATLEPGMQADRDHVGGPWTFSVHEPSDEMPSRVVRVIGSLIRRRGWRRPGGGSG